MLFRSFETNFLPAGSSRARYPQALSAVLAMAALILQLIVPNVARADQGAWIEICSEAGAVLVLVEDAETPGQNDGNCPECADCVLCAMATTALPLTQVRFQPLIESSGYRYSFFSRTVLPDRPYLWPAGRGPPVAHIDKQDRAIRMVPVSACGKGAAPWT